MHLGGGEAGLRGFMEHIGPSFAQIDLHEPDLSDAGMAPVLEQVEAAYGLPPEPGIARERDRVQEAIIRLRAPGGAGGDQDQVQDQAPPED
jgi:ketoreductase RED1